MTFYGAVIIAFGMALAIAAARREQKLGGALMAPIALYVWHTAMVVAYWVFAQYSLVDATYYFDNGSIGDLPGVGTDLIMWTTGALRTVMPGATMLDVFFVYGLFGYVGLIVFLRTASSLTGAAYASIRRWIYLCAFLPGLSFWSAAIGKDAPMFLGVQLVIWGICRPGRRWPAIAVGFALAFLIRPHIAVAMGAAAGLALVFSSGVNIKVRLAAIASMALLAVAAVPFAAHYLSIQSLDRESLESYVFAEQHDLEIGGSAVDLSSYPFPIKLFTYLYRPSLIEARSGTALLAAIENTVELGLTLVLAFNIPKGWRLVRRMPALAFCVAFFFIGAGASALMTANLGMAVRQKEQFMPCMFLLLTTFLAARAWQLRSAAPISRPQGARRSARSAGNALPAGVRGLAPDA